MAKLQRDLSEYRGGLVMTADEFQEHRESVLRQIGRNVGVKSKRPCRRCGFDRFNKKTSCCSWCFAPEGS